jgi:hypothetical protein
VAAVKCGFIVSQVAHGATTEDILRGYPELEPADIQQALQYAAWLTREEVRTSSSRTWVSCVLVEWLRAQGHDAIHLREEGLGG